MLETKAGISKVCTTPVDFAATWVVDLEGVSHIRFLGGTRSASLWILGITNGCPLPQIVGAVWIVPEPMRWRGDSGAGVRPSPSGHVDGN